MRLHSDRFADVPSVDTLCDDAPMPVTIDPSKPIPWYCNPAFCMTMDCAEYGTPEDCPIMEGN